MGKGGAQREKLPPRDRNLTLLLAPVSIFRSILNRKFSEAYTPCHAIFNPRSQIFQSPPKPENGIAWYTTTLRLRCYVIVTVSALCCCKLVTHNLTCVCRRKQVIQNNPNHKALFTYHYHYTNERKYTDTNFKRNKLKTIRPQRLCWGQSTSRQERVGLLQPSGRGSSSSRQ